MPLLLASGLSKSYASTQVLTDVSVALEPGEKAALVGRNGVGKTTLLRVLAGLEAPDRGTRVLSGGATRRRCARSRPATARAVAARQKERW